LQRELGAGIPASPTKSATPAATSRSWPACTGYVTSGRLRAPNRSSPDGRPRTPRQFDHRGHPRHLRDCDQSC